MISRPARSWSRMAKSVASSCACSRKSGATRHNSLARTRGGKRPANLILSISQSGWAYEPTSVVGNSTSATASPSNSSAMLAVWCDPRPRARFKILADAFLFHHQPEAQHPKSSAIHNNAGRLSYLLEVRYDYPRACWARTRAHVLTLVAQKLMPVQEFCNAMLGSKPPMGRGGGTL